MSRRDIIPPIDTALAYGTRYHLIIATTWYSLYLPNFSMKFYHSTTHWSFDLWLLSNVSDKTKICGFITVLLVDFLSHLHSHYHLVEFQRRLSLCKYYGQLMLRLLCCASCCYIARCIAHHGNTFSFVLWHCTSFFHCNFCHAVAFFIMPPHATTLAMAFVHRAWCRHQSCVCGFCNCGSVAVFFAL